MSKRSDLIKSEELLNKGMKELANGSKRKAFECYEQSAKLGNLQAMYYAGLCLMNGQGTARDEQRGFDLLFDSASEGNLEALLKVADCYLVGTCIDKDEEKAFQMYEIVYENANASELIEEFPEVCLSIGKCYYSGTGTNQDKDKALLYLHEAMKYYELYDESIEDYMQQKEECENIINELEG